MNKQDIKKFLIQKELVQVEKSEINYAEYLSGNSRACDQVIDLGDQSQLNVRTELTHKLDSQIHLHGKKLDVIKRLKFEPTSRVELGAIIETEKVFLIIATSIPPFEYDNNLFIGISTEAPLYKCLEGKSIGDECIYNQVKFLIKNIY